MRRGSGGSFQFDHMSSTLMFWSDLFLNKKGKIANIPLTYRVMIIMMIILHLIKLNKQIYH